MTVFGPLPDLPQELADAAYRSGDEFAWSPSVAASVAKWLGEHGYAILGTELWVLKPDGRIISLPLGLSGLPEVHGNTVDRKNGETWSSFTRRATAETLAYLGRFNPAEIVEEGDLRFNVTWVSEIEFEQLRPR
jgi:hypothetical protein